MIHPHPRSGAPLTEVLVAIFVMAIGLLALLTLFPLGALSMAQAIKDDRTGHSGKNGFAIASVFGIQTDPIITNCTNLQPGSLFTGPPSNSPVYFFNPYPGISQTFTTPPVFLLAPHLKMITGYDGPSYPVFVDPWGWNYFHTGPTAWAISNPSSGALVNYWTMGNAPPPAAANPPGVMNNYSCIP